MVALMHVGHCFKTYKGYLLKYLNIMFYIMKTKIM